MTHRPALSALFASLALLLAAGLAAAASWGGITPGETVRREVEARYGRPSHERTVTEEGRTANEWTYVGDRAPRGFERIVVSFGLVQGQGFAPDLVRALTLYPKRGVFSLRLVTDGWGKPDAIGTDEQSGRPAFRYDTRALLIVFDRTGEWAEVMVFSPERPGPVQ